MLLIQKQSKQLCRHVSCCFFELDRCPFDGSLEGILEIGSTFRRVEVHPAVCIARQERLQKWTQEGNKSQQFTQIHFARTQGRGVDELQVHGVNLNWSRQSATLMALPPQV